MLAEITRDQEILHGAESSQFLVNVKVEFVKITLNCLFVNHKNIRWEKADESLRTRIEIREEKGARSPRVDVHSRTSITMHACPVLFVKRTV
jgi:hypothetical protein